VPRCPAWNNRIKTSSQRSRNSRKARSSRVVLRPHVFVRDALATVEPQLMPRLQSAAYDLTEYCPDEPHGERLVRALIEPELPQGPRKSWMEPYANHGLEELYPGICPYYSIRQLS